MHKIRVFYYQNKETIWKIITISLFILLLIKGANFLVSSKTANNNEQNQRSASVTESTSTPSEPVLSGSKIQTYDAEEQEKIIKDFFDYCNNQDIEKAYSLLSTDCKEILFSDINTFYNNYYKLLFSEKRDYSIESLYTKGYITYYVKIMNNMLATGEVKDSYNADYFTIVYENGEIKLNINNFIAKENINKKVSNGNGLIIEVANKQMFKGYEIYEFNITNKTEKTVLLDTKTKEKSIYLKDEREVEYTAYMNEIIDSKLKVIPQQTTNLKIKFNKLYNPEREDRRIYFTDIVSDYDEYMRGNQNVAIEELSISV